MGIRERERERKGGKEDRRQEEGKEGKREGKKGRAEARRKSALYSTSRQLASSNRTDLISCWVKQTRSMPGVKSYSPPYLNISLVQTSFSPDPRLPAPEDEGLWFDLHKALFFYPDAQWLLPTWKHYNIAVVRERPISTQGRWSKIPSSGFVFSIITGRDRNQ